MPELDPRAWMRPGAESVAPGLWRIPLPLPLDGLTAVNAYLFSEGDDLVLVDPGWATPESEAALAAAMSSLGFDLGDVSRIVSTHIHWDHYSEALVLRRRYGIPVSLGAGEKHSVEAYHADIHPYGAQVQRLVESGAPQLAGTIATLEAQPFEVDLPLEAPNDWLVDRQSIALGGGGLIVHATPGHTRGHVVLMDSARGVLITGDHVLPRITPSVGLEYEPEAFPLRSFLSSLALLRSLPDATMLPAHGNVTAGVHHRVDELIAHHETRFDAISRQVSTGAETAMDVASRLTWTSRGRDFGTLSPFHQMTAVIEVASHLDLLEHRGRVIRQVVENVDRFHAA